MFSSSASSVEIPHRVEKQFTEITRRMETWRGGGVMELLIATWLRNSVSVCFVVSHFLSLSLFYLR